jgi:hypothetical protein
MTPDPDWETLLSSAAFVVHIVPDAIFGDSAFADADEVRRRFATALADLELVSGWLPTPVGRMAISDGRFDGVETTIRDQTRFGPLETVVEVGAWGEVVVPTLAEMLRIMTWLVISRNAARDYVDVAALAERLGREGAAQAISSLGGLYPQSNGSSAVQQAARHLAQPRPFDLVDFNDSATRPVKPLQWKNRKFVLSRCRELATDLILSLPAR